MIRLARAEGRPADRRDLPALLRGQLRLLRDRGPGRGRRSPPGSARSPAVPLARRRQGTGRRRLRLRHPHRERAAYRWAVEVTVYVHDAFGARASAARSTRSFSPGCAPRAYFKAYAGILVPNPASQAFHESMGFTLVGIYRKRRLQARGLAGRRLVGARLKPRLTPRRSPRPLPSPETIDEIGPPHPCPLFIGGEWIRPEARRHSRSTTPRPGTSSRNAPRAGRPRSTRPSRPRPRPSRPGGTRRPSSGPGSSSGTASSSRRTSTASAPASRSSTARPSSRRAAASTAGSRTSSTPAAPRRSSSATPSRTSPATSTARRYLQPIGVCAGITPFNFPAMVPLWMFPLAIACGNTFVLKPSEKVPLTAIILVELLEKAGLPKGVLNVVHGGRECVDALLAHPKVRAVSFVGSTPVARYIHETGTRNGKRVQANGGAKNYIVVMPDADMPRTVEALSPPPSAARASAAWRARRRSPSARPGRQLLPQLVEAARSIKVGRTDTPMSQPDMGPLITGPHRDRVAASSRAGRRRGRRSPATAGASRSPTRRTGSTSGPPSSTTCARR
jgi:hypothetical protein